MDGRLFLLRSLNNCDLEIQLGNFNLQTYADDHSNNRCDASSHFFGFAKISNEVGFLVFNVSKYLKDKWSVSKVGLALQRDVPTNNPNPNSGGRHVCGSLSWTESMFPLRIVFLDFPGAFVVFEDTGKPLVDMITRTMTSVIESRRRNE